MNDDRDEILDELRALVSVEPTPGFEASVRREVESRARWSSGAWWTGAAALISATAIVALLTSARPAPVREPRMTVSTPALTPALPVTETPQPTIPAQTQLTTARASSLPPRKTPAAPEERDVPEVILPPDQAIALQRLMAGVRGGQLMWGAGTSSDVPVVVEPLPDIPPVRIEALPGGVEDAKTGTGSNSKRVEHHDPTQA